MRINVRNMVCRNCVAALKGLLSDLGYKVGTVGLGYAEIDAEALDPDCLARLDEGLALLGFERIANPADTIIEQVKHEIISHVGSDEPCSKNLSRCISEATGMGYRAVSRLFSSREGITVERYYVAVKIEKIKELLSYGDISLSEIAYRLGYSSVAFLSRQFKKETGMTPTQYQNNPTERKGLSLH